jgi:hypothetical protein
MLRLAGALCGVILLTIVGLFVVPKLIPTNVVSGQFAADRDAIPRVPFDAKRAMRYLEDICKIGPRISGSAGMKKQQELLQKHFEEHGAKVELQRFPAKQRSQANAIEMANMIVSWHPEQTRRVILCCHYDTRPIADQEPDRHDWHKPFVSANDGGSGVAFLMELAHHMKDLKTQVGVDFVIFDGEEYIFDNTRDEYFFGSEHFASDYRKSKPKHKYLGAVLLDMIAGKGAKFPVDRVSFFQAGKLVQEIWTIARQEQCDCFVDRLNDQEILDDHVPLNRNGIPAIDIIDFSFAHWHRLSDVPANCAPEPMDQVARVLTIWLQQVK